MTDPEPPPLPPSLRDAETLPGIDSQQDAMALRRENTRLRRHRDQLQGQLDEFHMASEAPPPTRKQKLVRLGLTSAQVTLIGSVVAVLVPIIAKKWPAYADIVSGIAQALGLQ